MTNKQFAEQYAGQKVICTGKHLNGIELGIVCGYISSPQSDLIIYSPSRSLIATFGGCGTELRFFKNRVMTFNTVLLSGLFCQGSISTLRVVNNEVTNEELKYLIEILEL